MIRTFRNPMLAAVMAAFLFLLCASPAAAGMVGPAAPDAGGAGGGDVETIQRALELTIVQEKLNAYGLSPDEVSAKLASMTDGQIHLLAQASERVLAGGDGLGVVIGVLIIVILVIIIMKLLDKQIIIK